MTRWKRPLAWLLAVLPVLALIGLYLLLGTQAGLRFSLRMAQARLPGALEVERFEGRWLGPLEVEGLDYREGGRQYRVEHISFHWNPAALLRGTLAVERLAVAGVRVETGTQVSAPQPQSAGFEPGFRLPLAVRIEALEIRDVQVLRGAEPVFRLDRMALAAAGEAGRLQLGSLELLLPQGRLAARGEVGLGADAATDLRLDWSAELEPLHSLAGRARLSGDWRRLTLDYAVETPAPVRLQLTLRQPFGALQWQAGLQLPETGLRTFSAAWPDLRLAADVQGGGDLESLRLEAEVRTDAGAAQPYPLRLALEARDQGDGWRLERARLAQADGEGWLELSGQGMYGGIGTLEGHWRDLGWPPAAPDWRSPEGSLSWSGLPTDYDFTLSGRLEGRDVPPLALRAQGEGNLEELRFAPLAVELLEGRLEADGRLYLQPALRWQAEVRAEGINPGAWQDGWPGRLDAALTLAGAEDPAGLRQEVLLHRLKGTLRGYPVRGEGGLRMRGGRLAIEQLRLQSGSARLTLDGRLDERWQGDWRLQAADLAEVLPEGRGRLSVTGQVRGPRDGPRLTARAEADGLAWRMLSLERLQADLDWALARDARWHLAMTAEELRYGDRRLARLAAGVEGTAADHRLQLTAAREDADLALELRGQWREGIWQGHAERADWHLDPLGAWTLVQVTPLRFGADQVRVETLCWRQEDARLCLEGKGDAREGWDTALDLSDYPLARLAAYLPPGNRMEGQLEAHWQGHLAPDGRPRQGDLALRLSPGRLVFGAGEGEVLDMGGGGLQARVEGDRARFDLVLALAGEDRLTGAGTLSGIGGDVPRLDAEVQGRMRELGILEVFSTELESVQGELRLDLAARGPLARPALSGKLQLRDAALTLPGAGVRLEDLSLGVVTDDLQRLDIEAGARSGGEGRLAVEGGLELPPGEPWRLQLAARGEGFLAVDLPEYRVRVSPDLRLVARPGRVELEGEVGIPKARLRPRDFSGAVAPSPDAVRVGPGAPGPRPDPWRIHTDVRVRLGDDVQFNGFGLKGFVGGALRVRDEPGRLTSGQGTLEIREGRYKAYGQDLRIETGRLLYTDTPLDNPGLDIRASRRVGEVTAGIRVGGQLRDPSLSLYSDPAMAESEALSYLLLGRPLGQASGAEGATLMQAASAAGLGGGGLLAAQIGERFGFDEVEVGGGGSLDEAALLVGKYLSPRLYVQYSVGLLEPISTFRVRYRMSRRWTLQTETGVESGADLLYTLE